MITKIRLVCSVFFLAFASSHAVAQTRGTTTIYFENDLFAGTDRYYTNGTKISYTSENFIDTKNAPNLLFLRPVLQSIPYFSNRAHQKNFGLTLGQNIYTPDNTETTERIPADRPYAGWLYLGLSVDRKSQFQRDSFGINLGLVGSYSQAEETQRLIHEARGFAVPQGWDNQLSNELGFVATYQKTWRWPQIENRRGLHFETLPSVGAALGNVAIYASSGVEMRLGFNLPDDFGTSTIQPTSTTESALTGLAAADRARVFDLGFHVFGRAEARLVGHNIFLDGNTFQDSQSVNHKPVVADLSLGAALNYRNTKVVYAFVYRTQEFAGQASGQLFGSLALSLAY